MVSSPRTDYPVRTRAGGGGRILYEWRILLISLLCALPGVLICALLLWKMPWNPVARFSALFLFVVLNTIFIAVQHDRIRKPLHTLTNIVSALREEDYSFRARGAQENGALGDLATEINSLADLLAQQRTRTVEATALLRRVVEVIDAPLFAFDPEGRLRLVNPAGERLLQKPSEALIGRSAEEVGIANWLDDAESASPLVLQQAPSSRWLIRRSQFRQGGVPHTLIVLSDVSRALREQERTAWQRLIRVLGHELNNSLAPIKSIAGTLSLRLREIGMQETERQDFTKGLGIIESRSASLHRFLQSYRQLAQMPLPSRRKTEISSLIERVAALETRVNVVVESGPKVVMMLDPDQIEQMMVNLIKNASEAALEGSTTKTTSDQTPPEVAISWRLSGSRVYVLIRDNGPGLANSDNLFVPFYTTKSEGSGIGLLLSREIAEAHSGSIELANRQDSQGCIATILLPMN